MIRLCSSQLSPLDQERLAFGPEMLTLSFFAVLVGGVVCFILSLIVEINETRRANTLLDGVSTKVLHQALLSVQEPSHVRRGAIISPVLRLRNHSMGASKHDSDVKLLIMGKVRMTHDGSFLCSTFKYFAAVNASSQSS